MSRTARSGARAFVAIFLAGCAQSATGQIVMELPAHLAGVPLEITAGFDDSVWFTEGSAGLIGRLGVDGSLAEFPASGGEPRGITRGPDGNYWYASAAEGGNEGAIVRMTPGGISTVFTVPATPSAPQYITAGPNGTLWFSDAADRIGRITTDGQITLYPIPTADGVPYQLAAGPDGNMWFTEFGGNKIGRIDPGGVVTEFEIPTAASVPWGITAGPDGALWFTESRGGKVGRITLGGVITEFSLPVPSLPLGIALGSDGNLWFANGSIDRITPAGAITEFPTPTPEGSWGITNGPGGALWFTETGGAKIAKITTGACVSTNTTLCLNGQRFAVSVEWGSGSSPGGGAPATAVPLTPTAGYFWFFTANNVELAVKIVDGSAVNGRFWVFGGGLSNVAYTITVTDTLMRQTRTYANADGSLTSFADTDAFLADPAAPQEAHSPLGNRDRS